MAENGHFRRDSGPDGETTQIQKHQIIQDEEDHLKRMWEEFERSQDGEEIDPEQFLRDMAILDDISPLPDFDMSSSWEDFREKYGYLLASSVSADQQSSASDSAKRPKRRRSMKPIRMFLAVVMIFVMLMVAASCGVIERIIQALADWTDQVFHYQVTQEVQVEAPTPEDTTIEYYDSLEEALEAYGVSTEYAGMQMPEGFTISSVLVREHTDSLKIIASYTRGEEEILLSIWHYKDSTALDLNAAEKLPPDAEVYVNNGIKYYILDNTLTTSATWIAGTEMYILAGPFSTLEIKQMIDSIYEG